MRQYVIDDSALATSGLSVAAYIAANYIASTFTKPDYNLMWIGSHVDHDGNTAEHPSAFKAR